MSEPKILFNDSYLTLKGERFHYSWLRDYCLCPACRDRGSSQRIFDLSELSSDLPKPKPLSVKEEVGNVIIDWDERPAHQSIFPISWLLGRANHFNLPIFDQQVKQKQLWDRDWLEEHPPQRHNIHNSSKQVWMDELMHRGFTILSDIQPDGFVPFLNSLGRLYRTEYGETITIKHMPNYRDFSYDGHRHLPLHTDFRYMSAHRWLICLYFVENSTQGGESVILDGFRLAEDYRRKYPHYFESLVETPAIFRYFDPEHEYLFEQETPTLKLNRYNQVSDFYIGHHSCDRDIPFARIDAFYEAYYEFYRAIKSSQYRYTFRLESGQCALLQNFRIPHGRLPFDPNSGNRHLEVGHVDWDYIVGRQNFKQAKQFYLSI